MEEIRLIVDLVLAVGLAFVGGAIAQKLRQPVILGYLLAGFAIGPFTPGPVADQHTLEILAEMGVAFLMFALGAELRLAELQQLGRVALLGGSLQILGTTVFGVLLAPLLQLSATQGVFFGALLALSSTVLVLKILMGKGELQSPYGRLALGFLIVQDLAVVPMVILLSALGGGVEQLPLALLGAATKVGLIVVAVYVVGTRLVPWVLTRAALSQTRELFLLGVVVLALGTAVATRGAGLSIAFGAFLAGLVVAESEFRTRVIAEVLPFRDLFAALFFVSIGMLLDPTTLMNEAGLILLFTAVVVVGKALVATTAALIVGASGPAALLTGLAIAQIGEFSFVLARIGVTENIISPRLFDLTLATALLSIILTPSQLRIGPVLLRLLPRLPVIGGLFCMRVEQGQTAPETRNHVIICGYGRVGRELADELEGRGDRYVVVEYNPSVVAELRANGRDVVYGDAGSSVVLEHANVAHARLLAVLVPDGVSAEVATRSARQLAPNLDIIARATHGADVPTLWRAGATEVVQPEFEAGIEVIRHSLRRFGQDLTTIEERVAARRAKFYGTGVS